MTGGGADHRRSAAAAWAALAAWVIIWDVVATRHGYETMSACWRRWRRNSALAGEGLDAASDWLDRHLCR